MSKGGGSTRASRSSSPRGLNSTNSVVSGGKMFSYEDNPSKRMAVAAEYTAYTQQMNNSLENFARSTTLNVTKTPSGDSALHGTINGRNVSINVEQRMEGAGMTVKYTASNGSQTQRFDDLSQAYKFIRKK